MWVPPRWQDWNQAAAMPDCYAIWVCPYRKRTSWIQAVRSISLMAQQRCGSGITQNAGRQNDNSSFRGNDSSGGF